MKRVVRKQPNSEIPTSSMADIAFLLIVFFMVTAVFAATKGLEFKLPEQETEQNVNPDDDEAVFIQVFPNGNIAVDCTPYGHEEILDYLEPKLANNPEKPVIIYSDAEAEYQGMVAVYDVLLLAEEDRGFKVKNISIPTTRDVNDYIALFGSNPFETRCQ